MRLRRFTAYLAIICLLINVPAVFAQYSSSNYSANELQFGSGGSLNQSSNNYQSQVNVGATGVGDFQSANYRSNVGFLTQNTLFLEMDVTGGEVFLGDLSTTSTGSGTGTFSVKTYLSQAYTVVTASPPPTQEEGYQLKALTTPSSPTTGTEQFGMNLVKNTDFCGSGCDLGANPVHEPDDNFADGTAAAGYDTSNLFKYHQGDVIASSPATLGSQSIGETVYTISYIANQAPLTRAGLYTMNHDVVVVGTF
ncbi:MAG TPA: hypothetical protein VFW90_03795 [Candidatus Saccharimonadales bacterium]|nr:hypothetical protein [Candidatus Saccharimonadales bacterium]